MKLIPEQVVNLRKNSILLRLQLEKYKDYLSEKRNLAIDDIFRCGISDSLTDSNYHKILEDLNNIQYLLEHSSYITDYNFDYIDIGTKFEASFNGEDKEIYTLVENHYGVSINDGFVSINSPLGKAILGAREGDTVSFFAPNGRTTIKISKIIRDKNQYLFPIRNVPYSNRKCKASQKEIHDGVNYSNITFSQRTLLINELKRLEKDLTLENKTSLKARIAFIKSILKNSPVSSNIASDIIDIGSCFSLTLMPKDREEIKYENVELINRAVSDEYAFEYLERISPLGHKIYGLREGDYFVIRRERENILGVVSSICEQKVTSYVKK